MAKEYELVGGQPVKVSPLEVSEAGTYEAPAGQAFNPVKVSGGGSSGGIFWVTLTYDDVGDTYTANKSYNDIAGAVASGLLPVFINATDDMYSMYHLWSCSYYDGNYNVLLTAELEANATTATENLIFVSGGR